MKTNWKQTLVILTALAAIACTSLQPTSRKIYFDLARDPVVLVNESGVDIIVEKRNICYSGANVEANISGWHRIVQLSQVTIPAPGEGNTHIQSGGSVPSTGACRHKSDLMNAWRYQISGDPNRMFAVYSDNTDPADTSQHYLPITTSALASTPFQVNFQNTSSITINVPLNCLATPLTLNDEGDLALTHLERQTDYGWELLNTNLKYCSGSMEDKWLDIAPQASGMADWRSAYAADFALEKGRYRWVTNFCTQSSPQFRTCFTSFSLTFEYTPK